MALDAGDEGVLDVVGKEVGVRGRALIVVLAGCEDVNRVEDVGGVI